MKWKQLQKRTITTIIIIVMTKKSKDKHELE